MGQTQAADRLKSVLERLFATSPSDEALFEQFSSFLSAKALGGLTWFWGPELYRRNRLRSLPFIMRHFSQYDRESPADDNLIPWSAHADRLESWLGEARENRDSWLVQKLTRWKFSKAPFGIDEERFGQELLRQFREATKKSAQAQVLHAFDSRFTLTEPIALAIYQIDPSCSEFLQRHFLRGVTASRDKRRQLWRSLFEAAQKANDNELAFLLYRWQVSQEDWQKDVERLALEISDADQLHEELRKRNPSGARMDWHEPILALLKLRGRETFPYVRECLSSLHSAKCEPLLELARTRHWWDLWAGIIHATGNSKDFNRQIVDLLDRKDLEDLDRRAGLAELGAPTTDWSNRPYFLWRPLYLDDATATRLCRHDPLWLKGPFQSAIVNVYDPAFAQLLNTAVAHEDHQLVDLIASCYTRTWIYQDYSTPQHDEKKKTIEILHQIYQDLRDRNPTEFARRVSHLLNYLPQNSLPYFPLFFARNALARLFLVESSETYLSAPEALANLLEAKLPEVQNLGFQVLALDDSRARWFVVLSLDLLLGSLRRPRTRRGLKALCLALANAVREDASTAGRILKRARECLARFGKKAFKEPLIGLIGKILFQHPSLRGQDEQPVIYLPRKVGS
jgi:hypothetical protein